jgi:hypothetical protein
MDVTTSNHVWDGYPHTGLAYGDLSRCFVGVIMRVLLLLWAQLSPEEMANHVQFL